VKKIKVYFDTSVIGGFYDKIFDCVKMMRDIRKEVNQEISKMSSTQLLDYLKKGMIEYNMPKA
jgi:hypothetical protein